MNSLFKKHLEAFSKLIENINDIETQPDTYKTIFDLQLPHIISVRIR